MRNSPLLIISGLYTALAAVLCFTPLANVLGYEFALIMGVFAAIAAPMTGTCVALTAHATQRLTPHRSSATMRALGIALLQLVAPLLLIMLNGLRVRNCNYFTGLGFFVALPVCTALYGAMLGVAVGTAFPTQRALRGLGLATAIVLPLACTLWSLYTQPPIFAFDHLWGHFAGSLYDEDIRIDQRLVLFRIGTLLRVIGLGILIQIFVQRRRSNPVLITTFTLCILAVLAAYDVLIGAHAGFRITRAQLQDHLPIIEERPGLIIHLPKTVTDAQRHAIAEDHAFRLEQITSRLAITLPNPIHSYVYANAADKARMMGGHATMFAKPWLGEIHIHGLDAPHDVMAHELVHVVAAQFGSKPLGVSARAGILVNMGIVEGLAEALTAERDLLDLDHASRAMRDLHLAPDLQPLLSAPGFWRAPPRRAYTVTGSFIRYLLNTRGPRALKDMYASGDFERAYTTPLRTLIADWQKYLDNITVTTREEHLAKEYFRSPSIFAKPCAHEIATLRQQARTANAHDAVTLYRTICAHLDNAPDAQLDLAFALQRSGDHKGFALLAHQLLDNTTDTPLNATQTMHVQEALGTQAVNDGKLQDAIHIFHTIQQLPIPLDSERMQWVRIWALEQPQEWRTPLWQFLSGELARPVGMIVLQQMHTQFPHDKTIPYLIGRQLTRDNAWSYALPYLHAAEGHPYDLIDAERLRLEAETLRHLRQFDAAEATYTRYIQRAPTSGERSRAIDQLSRVDWEKLQP